jgi:hypothetical protein
MSQKTFGQKSQTSVIYIGNKRYHELSNMAIDASFHAGFAITAARFLQFLIDNYGEEAKKEFIKLHSNPSGEGG